MTIKSKKEDIAEKIIDAEIQKAGERIEEMIPHHPEIEATPEEMEKELEALQKKRIA